MFENLVEVNGTELPPREILRNGRYDFIIEGVRIEAVIQNIEKKQSEKLFILFSGARDPNKQPLPKFDRWKWKDRFPGVMVNISDPTLHFLDKKLRIGWYFGTEHKNYANIISKLVKSIADYFSILPSDIICYGSSAGGFGAIAVSSLIKDSTAVAINPQILLRNYISSSYKSFLKATLGVSDDNSLDESLKNRMDAAKLFLEAEDTKCLYVQNIKDFSHLENHYNYFCDTTDSQILGGYSSDGRVKTWLYDSNIGHGPEPSSMVADIIQEAVNLSNKTIDKNILKKDKANTFNAFEKFFFVSSKKECDDDKLFENENKLNIYSNSFFYSKNLKYKLAEEDSIKVILIGIVIDIFNSSFTESEIAKELLSKWQSSKSKFYEYLDDLAGSFVVLVFEENQGVSVFTDACGTYSVFYTDSTSDLCISSHPRLISKYIGKDVSDFQKYWSHHPAFSSGGKYYPGNLTEFDSVLQLTPNTYISSIERLPVRYFPREPLATNLSYDEIVEFISTSLKAQLKNLISRFKVSMSLSGGLDSRISLAASKEIKNEIEYFTYSIRGNKYLKTDMEIAKKLAEELEFSHTEIRVKTGDVISQRVKQQRELDSPGNGANNDLTQAYFDEFGSHPDRVHIRSNLMEIARGYYLANPANRRNAYTPRKISGLFRGKTRDELSPIFDKFLRDTQFYKTAGKKYHYSDLFYWEHRMGVFVANVVKRERPIHETLMLFNNRKILNAALTLDIEDRISAKLFYDLCEVMWPEVLNYEFSSGSKVYSVQKN